MGVLEARRTRPSAWRLAGLMVVFAAFGVAVLLNDEVLAGEGRRAINDRGTQLLVAWLMLGLAAWMLPGALRDLYDGRPAVRLDRQGGEVRATLRHRRFRWDEVAAIDRSRRWFTIRLRRGRPIRVGGEFEPPDLSTLYDFAITHWMSTALNDPGR